MPFNRSHGNNLLDTFIFLDVRSQNGIEARIQGQGKINFNTPIRRPTVLALLLQLEKSQGVSVNPSISFFLDYVCFIKVKHFYLRALAPA